MRISTNQIYRSGIDAITNGQSALNKTQNQLSTGRRILNPSDDPAGSAALLGLDQAAEVTRQHQKNADTAKSRLEREESSLQSLGDLLQRVRELAVQALNDTNGAGDRRAIALEVDQHLRQALDIANGRDGNGEYLFGGFYNGNTPPVTDNGAGVFTYNGDQGQRVLQIGASRQVADRDHGVDVFMKIPAAGGGTQDMFTTFYALVSDLNANAPSSTSLTDIDNALGNVLEVRARVGARLNAIDQQQSMNESALYGVDTASSRIRDLDYADAISRLNQQQVALEAAQQTYVRVQSLSLFNFLR